MLLYRFIFLFLMFSILTFSGCGTIDYDDAITDIFGESENIGDVGVFTVEDKGSRQIISYRCNFAGLFGIEEETGSVLTGKIKRLYEMYPEIDQITVVVFTETINKTGDKDEKRVISFDLNRKLYDKISQKNFPGSDLLKVAENVKLY